MVMVTQLCENYIKIKTRKCEFNAIKIIYQQSFCLKIQYGKKKEVTFVHLNMWVRRIMPYSMCLTACMLVQRFCLKSVSIQDWEYLEGRTHDFPFFADYYME